jgi:hypothetical protein
MFLAVGHQDEALKHLEKVAEKARTHEVDQGFLNAMNRMNLWADPRLETPAFRDVLGRIGMLD